MLEVGTVWSTLIVTVSVTVWLLARSVAVPLAMVPTVSCVIVHDEVTLTGPVTPIPPGALALPSATVPDATHPAIAIPERPSEHVNVTRTLLVYQPLLPAVPVMA